MLKQKARTVALAVLVTDLALTAVSLPLTWAFRHGVLTSLMPTVFPLPLYPLNQYMPLVIGCPVCVVNTGVDLTAQFEAVADVRSNSRPPT